MNIMQYKNDCLTIARDISAYDTGNLRYNATTSIDIINGFAIKISGLQAYYWKYLDSGTKNSSKHKGYVNEIRNQLRLFINDRGNSRYNNMTSTTKNVNKYSTNTFKRDRIQKRSLDFEKKGLGGV